MVILRVLSKRVALLAAILYAHFPARALNGAASIEAAAREGQAAALGAATENASIGNTLAGFSAKAAEALQFPLSALLMAQALQSLIQAGLQVDAANNFGGTADAAGVSNSKLKSLTNEVASKVKDAKRNLQSMMVRNGFSVEPSSGVIVDPNGVRYEFEQDELNDLNAGLNYGLTEEGVSAISEAGVNARAQISTEIAAAIEKDGARVISMQATASAGGYDYNANGADVNQKDPFSDVLNALKNQNRKVRAPTESLVAGLSVTKNGDRIGVMNDNLFMMVHRRYQLMRSQDEFIEILRPVK